ncbi:ABC transporter ATP-binding protein [Shewanella sp. KX20019]|uniref:ABC transporter ATP-binding protein n=1 Tax=Shewanella sp. KX20019 TaxID=2803864 RepID=UPI0019296747|nr:ABC transporter ATP-binding protein [Shewanella sp. KX20019]QQX80699.1 ABC transporter ATP-binding protein [Shewanella sp. KX20019]
MNSDTSITSNTPVVSVERVGLRFGDLDALQDINLEVYQGQTLALLGHNGAGKSSLIKLILGLIKPTSGKLTLQVGQALQPINIGYLPEDVSFYDKLTGWEVLSYFAALKGINTPRVKQLIAEFELEYAQHRQLKTYSKGMKQRLGVAQAILSQPDILLLDEPTVGLDPQASQFLYQKIESLKEQGCAVIICTHELSIVEKHLDRALLLAGGRRVGCGTLDELRHASGLKTQIRLPNFTDKLRRDSYLQSLSRGQALMMSTDERKAVIEYLVQQKSCTDFSVIEPSLELVYHHFMQQQPLHRLPADIAVTDTSPKGWLQSLLSPLARQSTL